jgi:hypothetical protein
MNSKSKWRQRVQRPIRGFRFKRRNFLADGSLFGCYNRVNPVSCHKLLPEPSTHMQPRCHPFQDCKIDITENLPAARQSFGRDAKGIGDRIQVEAPFSKSIL